MPVSRNTLDRSSHGNDHGTGQIFVNFLTSKVLRRIMNPVEHLMIKLIIKATVYNCVYLDTVFLNHVQQCY